MIGPASLRRLDRWLGIPACALATLLRHGARWFSSRPPLATPLRRVLFVQLAEGGSMVLADPAMRRIGAHAQLYCLTFAGNRHSLAIANTIAAPCIFTLRTQSLAALLIDTWRFLNWVRAQRIDAVIDCELFSRLSAVLVLLTGTTHRVGFQRHGQVGLYRGDLYTHPVRFDPQLHVAQNYLGLAHALLGESADAVALPRLQPRRFSEPELELVRERLAPLLPYGLAGRRLLLVNANASSMLPQRRWPQAFFAELVRNTMARFPDVDVLLIGAAEDARSTASIAADVDDARCIDVAGLFPLAQLPALFHLGSAMVSNDSGPAHYAGVTQLPVIVLFGPETPRLFRPLGRATVLSANLACSPCVNIGNQRSTDCRDNQCMRQIAVEQVLAELSAVLQAGMAQQQAPSLREPVPA